MIINPAFFSYDNFKAYADGPLDTPRASLGWWAAGVTVPILLTWSRDNFTAYTNGSLDSPNGGMNWADAGTTTYYLNT